jgi:hypothetical protein
MGLFGGLLGVAGSAVGFFGAKKAEKEAARREAAAKREMDKYKSQYASIDTSNPYLNMTNTMAGLENTMEDATINQKQAEMEAQQFQQSQANILDSMRGAAGGSGIAATAQALAQQGQQAAQKSAASIGAQESANQAAALQQAGKLQEMEAREAGRLQGMERQGEILSRQQQQQQIGTLLGMSQSDVAAERQLKAQATEAKTSALGSGLSALGGFFSDRRLKKNIKLIGSSPSGLKIYAFEYIDKAFGNGTFQGVMSDEISNDAVIKHPTGYDMVDYSKLDVEFKNIDNGR